MAGGKEIRTKIQSVKNTQKITSAMEMVAASKMRRAQDRMFASRPYVQHISKVVWHLTGADLDYAHSYLKAHEKVQKVGYIVISTDRGLCGGLNTNLFKKVLLSIKNQQDAGREVQVICIGSKAVSFFSRMDVSMIAQATNLGDAPKPKCIIGLTKIMLDAFRNNELDEVYICANRFHNTMTQIPGVLQLLPVTKEHAAKISNMGKDGDGNIPYHADYLYEPDAKKLLNLFMDRYIESLLYQGILENIASEMSARMVAMKAATDNASTLIDELQLAYNKARQFSITQELTEIVAGAAAV